MFETIPRPLFWTACVHLIVVALCALALGFPAPQVTGVHAALKPLKFAASVAIFVLTLGVLLPALSLGPSSRQALAWFFSVGVLAETVPIVVQAVRGTTSHYNTRGAFNAALVGVMFVTIGLITLALVLVTLVAWLRPLATARGEPMPPLLATAWRAGLGLLLLAPVSGFAMGGRRQHNVGGPDGGAGLPFLNWSVLFGDLRIAHFCSLHAVQLLPLLAWGLLHLRTTDPARRAALAVGIAVVSSLTVGTLMQALAGKPLIRGRAVEATPRGEGDGSRVTGRR